MVTRITRGMVEGLPGEGSAMYSSPNVIQDRVWISDVGWNPETKPTYGRSTPWTAMLAVGGNYDEYGAPSRHYRWGIQSWMTNGSTGPMTNISGVANGFVVRAVDATAAQCGDGGDAHALEVIIGQFKPTATVKTVNGSTTLEIVSHGREGSRYCIGNEVVGSGIPAGAVVTGLVHGGEIDTGGYHARRTESTSGGSALQVGDEVVATSGGVYNRPCRFTVVRKVGSTPYLLLTDPGDYTAEYNGTMTFEKVGGGVTDLTATVSFVPAGYPYPDALVISAPATATANNVSIDLKGVANQNVGILISGSGDGGPDGKGNANGRGIQFQSYGDAALKYGIVFGGSGLRSDATGIRFAFESVEYGVSFESCNFSQSVININSAGVSSAIFLNNVSGSYGLRFAANCNFSVGAIYLPGQTIATDGSRGVTIAGSPAQKIGFYGASPITRPSLPDEENVTAADIRAALISLGLCA